LREKKIMRISNSIVRTQRIIFEQFTERIEILAEKMLEALWIDFDGEDEDEEDFDEEENLEVDAEEILEELEGDEENGTK
jgi:hypothetical protein